MVSDLFTSLVVKRPVYNISIPVLRDNEVRYIMSLGLVPEDLRALLEGQSLPPNWSAAIWDGKGVTMARTAIIPAWWGRPLPDISCSSHRARSCGPRTPTARTCWLR